MAHYKLCALRCNSRLNETVRILYRYNKVLEKIRIHRPRKQLARERVDLSEGSVVALSVAPDLKSITSAKNAQRAKSCCPRLRVGMMEGTSGDQLVAPQLEFIA